MSGPKTIDRLADTDDRQRFLDLAKREVLRARRYGKSLSAVVLGADHYDRIEDRHGPAVSEEVRRILALLCLDCLRDTDIFMDYGQGRFAILLPEAGAASAAQLAERLRTAVLGASLPTARGALTFTASFGVATASGETAELELLLDLARRALRTAMEGGGNRVEQSTVGEPTGTESPKPASAQLTPAESDALLKP